MRSILPNITTTNYPFGMLIKERSFSSDSYRFGYQGSLKDDEISGNGNVYSTEFRQLDIRICRWFSVDPEFSSQPWINPYSSMNNNPTNFTDIQGDKIDVTKTKKDEDSKATWEKVKNEWQTQAGLEIHERDDGTLCYIIDEKAKGYSKSLRKNLMAAIDKEETIEVRVDPDMGTGQGWDDPKEKGGKQQAFININAAQIEEIVKNSKNINPMAVSYGLAAYHEITHWMKDRGDGPEWLYKVNKGPVVRKVNRAQRQLGYDKRASYMIVNKSNKAIAYWPMSSKAKLKLLFGKKLNEKTDKYTFYNTGWRQMR